MFEKDKELSRNSSNCWYVAKRVDKGEDLVKEIKNYIKQFQVNLTKKVGKIAIQDSYKLH